MKIKKGQIYRYTCGCMDIIIEVENTEFKSKCLYSCGMPSDEHMVGTIITFKDRDNDWFLRHYEYLGTNTDAILTLFGD